MKNSDKIYQLYDKTYKKLFSHKRIVEDFLRGFVKEPFTQKMELIEPVFTEFTTRSYKSYYGDVIWKAKFKGKECFVFIIFEFLSKDDEKLVLRVLNYVVQFYLKLIKNEKYQLPLPPVFPVVIYTGEKSFSGKQNIRDIIGTEEKSLDKYIPDFKFFLLDINCIPKSQLLRLMIHSKNMASLLFDVEKMDEERLSEEINKIGEILRKYADPELIKDFQDILLSTTSKENKELIEIIKTIDQGDNMTFGEKVKRWEEKKRMEGEIKGEIKGKLEVAKNLLKDKADL